MTDARVLWAKNDEMQVNVWLWPGGEVAVATRERDGDTWGPPLEVVSDENRPTPIPDGATTIGFTAYVCQKCLDEFNVGGGFAVGVEQVVRFGEPPEEEGVTFDNDGVAHSLYHYGCTLHGGQPTEHFHDDGGALCSEVIQGFASMSETCRFEHKEV
jgi:hypothetical protein